MAAVILEDIKNLQHRFEDINENMTLEELVPIINGNFKNLRINLQIIQENLNAIRVNQKLINGEL